MNNKVIFLFISVVVFIFGVSFTLFAAVDSEKEEKSVKSESLTGNPNFGKYIGAALAIAAATIGSGLAVGKIGSAAMGAISEKPENSGISLIFVALAEGISLWGFLVAFLILNSK